MEPWKTELYHFGIPEMKWGIRRYQNPDGTLTPEGKKRYDKWQNKEQDLVNKKYRKALESEDRIVSKTNSKLKTQDKNSTKYKKTSEQLKRATERRDALAKQYKKEWDRVKNMTPEEVDAERSVLAKRQAMHFVGAFLMGGAISSAVTVNSTYKSIKSKGLTPVGANLTDVYKTDLRLN